MTGGFGFPIGCVAAVGATLLADTAGATRSPWYALVTLGLVVLLTAYWTSAPAAAGVTTVAWALHSGFVLGRAGELRFDAAAAVAASVLGVALALGLLTRSAVSSLQSRVSTLQTRVSSVRTREFAGPRLRAR